MIIGPVSLVINSLKYSTFWIFIFKLHSLIKMSSWRCAFSKSKCRHWANPRMVHSDLNLVYSPSLTFSYRLQFLTQAMPLLILGPLHFPFLLTARYSCSSPHHWFCPTFSPHHSDLNSKIPFSHTPSSLELPPLDRHSYSRWSKYHNKSSLCSFITSLFIIHLSRDYVRLVHSCWCIHHTQGLAVSSPPEIPVG